MHPNTDACKSTRPKTCRNTTFTWLERARPSTKSRHIIGAQRRGSYPYNVTVYPYNGYVRGTNPITRHVMSLTCTPTRMRANQHVPKHAATQPLHDSNARPSTKSRGIIAAHARSSYLDNVTVYPYNGCIRGTNPITRSVASLTCTLARMRANQHVPKHAATQPLHDSNARARAPNLVAS